MLPGSTYTTDEAVLTPVPRAVPHGPRVPTYPGTVSTIGHMSPPGSPPITHISRGRGQGFPELRWSSENDENQDP